MASVLESRQESKEEEEEEAEDEEEEEENEEEEAAQREKEAARLREKYDRAEALNYVYRYEMFVRYYNRNKA